MLVLDPRNTRSYSEAKSFQRQARTKTSAARAQETAESAALLDAWDRRSTSCVKDLSHFYDNLLWKDARSEKNS
jgi:hypothetical protein